MSFHSFVSFFTGKLKYTGFSFLKKEVKTMNARKDENREFNWFLSNLLRFPIKTKNKRNRFFSKVFSE